jgi:hypothetical protein
MRARRKIRRIIREGENTARWINKGRKSERTINSGGYTVKKRLAIFPSPAGMSLVTEQTLWPGIIELFII